LYLGSGWDDKSVESVDRIDQSGGNRLAHALHPQFPIKGHLQGRLLRHGKRHNLSRLIRSSRNHGGFARRPGRQLRDTHILGNFGRFLLGR